jgi:hypothetical protein
LLQAVAWFWLILNEFGKTKEGVIVLIDEIHARFVTLFYSEGYQERQGGEEQKNCLKNLCVDG